jgi:hypothetical protein
MDIYLRLLPSSLFAGHFYCFFLGIKRAEGACSTRTAHAPLAIAVNNMLPLLCHCSHSTEESHTIVRCRSAADNVSRAKIRRTNQALLPPADTLAHVSRRPTVRLKTGRPGLLSASRQK